MRDWQRVDLGASAAEVRRSPDGSSYAKSASDPVAVAELRDERDHVAWLADTGLPGPRVLDWVEAGDRAG